MSSSKTNTTRPIKNSQQTERTIPATRVQNPTKTFRKLLRSMRKKIKDPQVSITPNQVIADIKQAKASKAMGPDYISPIMLKISTILEYSKLYHT